MFRNAFRLPFRLLGIPIYLDVTFLVILPLLAWMIGSQFPRFVAVFGLPADDLAQRAGLRYMLGLVAAIGLFISVLIHELGHSIVARMYGVNVRNITLWLLGGVAQFDEMPRQRGGEAVVAIAGPITSFLLAVAFWTPLHFAPIQSVPYLFLLIYLFQMNLVLAIFNLLPALPLDGGRVLRSLLALRMPHARATEVSGGISRFLAIGLGILGLWSMNFWLVIIAFFIYMAVNTELRQTLSLDLLRGIGVRDLMTTEVKTVSPELTVGELTHRMLRDHHRAFPVMDGRLHGLVTLDQIAGASPETPVGQIMSPEFVTIPDEESAATALERMSRQDTPRLIVVDPSGEMVGILTRTDLMRAIQVRLVETGGTPQLARASS